MASVLTESGEQWVAQRMAGTSADDGRYVGWGTGAGTAAKGDTTLFTEAAEARVAGTVSVQGSGASAVYQVVATIVAAGAKTITNAGNFIASSGGAPILKGDFTGIVLGIGDSITFTLTWNPA